MEWLQTIYLGSAIIGGTLMVCQFVLTLFSGGDHDGSSEVHGDAGGHGDHEIGHEGDSWLVGLITFRTLVAGLTFFGLTGLASSSQLGNHHPLTLLAALAGGALALFGTAQLVRALHKLRHDGTVHIERAIGERGTIYLAIPPDKGAAGKVHVCVQNRTVEYQAVCPQGPLPTGTKVIVVNVLGPDTVEVAPAVDSTKEREAHV